MGYAKGNTRFTAFVDDKIVFALFITVRLSVCSNDIPF